MFRSACRLFIAISFHFKPFSRTLAGVSSSYAWLPFGHGARGCVGRELATAQLSHLLREVVRNFHLEGDNEERLELTLRMTGRPDGTVRVRIKDRDIDKS